MEFLYQIVAWLEAHDKLSGWAQTIGAVIALVVAIWIPARQRKAELLDARKQRDELNVFLTQAVYFLLNEVNHWLHGHKTMAKMPRFETRADVRVDDLLTRISALEMREIDRKRMIALFHARTAIHTTNLFMGAPFSQSKPLNKTEIELLEERMQVITEQIKQIQL